MNSSYRNIRFSQIGEKVNKYTIWVRMSGDTAVPVHYEMKGFNSLMGSHYDHYYLSYQNFSPEKPADEGITNQPKDNDKQRMRQRQTYSIQKLR